MNICLFDKNERDENGKIVFLKNDERANHILNVLKKNVGDTFLAGIVNEMAGIATIEKIDDGKIEFSFEPKTDGKPLAPIDFLVGFPRPIQLRRLLRDVAGLGARKIVLCGTELGEKSYLDSNVVKDGSAQKMLFDGTVQAGSTHVPELVVCKNIFDAFSILNADIKIALDNKRAQMSLGKKLRENADKKSICLAIGSERGWTENERDIFLKNGWSLCSMGSRVLRTETAVTVSGAIVLDALGFLD